MSPDWHFAFSMVLTFGCFIGLAVRELILLRRGRWRPEDDEVLPRPVLPEEGAPSGSLPGGVLPAGLRPLTQTGPAYPRRQRQNRRSRMPA